MQFSFYNHLIVFLVSEEDLYDNLKFLVSYLIKWFVEIDTGVVE